MDLATQNHQSNQQSTHGALEDQHAYRTKVSVLQIEVEASEDLISDSVSSTTIVRDSIGSNVHDECGLFTDRHPLSHM
jgi:hypothetical protein